VAITKTTKTVTLFDGARTAYTAAALSGPDLTNVYALNADPTRSRVSIMLGRTYSVFANQVAMYYYAMSHDPMFTDYLTIPVTAPPTLQTVVVVENCTDPLYFTIMPILAYDPTKTNSGYLVAVVERSTVANANPVL
jgi:hypothetical protein